MNTTRLIFFVLVFLFLGFLFYKIKPYEFTDNSKFILNLLFDELGAIYKRLKNNKISINEKNKLIERKNEIHNILEQFFGKNLITEENELV